MVGYDDISQIVDTLEGQPADGGHGEGIVDAGNGDALGKGDNRRLLILHTDDFGMTCAIVN